MPNVNAIEATLHQIFFVLDQGYFPKEPYDMANIRMSLKGKPEYYAEFQPLVADETGLHVRLVSANLPDWGNTKLAQDTPGVFSKKKPSEVVLADGYVSAAAQEGYAAYGNSTGNKNYQGLDMPSWFDLGEPIRAAWCAAAKRIIRTVLSSRLVWPTCSTPRSTSQGQRPSCSGSRGKHPGQP